MAKGTLNTKRFYKIIKLADSSSINSSLFASIIQYLVLVLFSLLMFFLLKIGLETLSLSISTLVLSTRALFPVAVVPLIAIIYLRNRTKRLWKWVVGYGVFQYLTGNSLMVYIIIISLVLFIINRKSKVGK